MMSANARGRARKPDPTSGRLRPVSVPKARKKASVERMADTPPAGAEIDPPTRPKRERVVLADRARATTTTSLRGRVELAQQTSWGEMLIKDLIRAQLRTATGLAVLVVVLLGALPLTFALLPEFASFTVAGVPVAWVLLGVLPFPLLFGAGLWYNRRAERHERAFVDMIEN